MDLQLSVVQRFCNRQRHSGRVKIPQTTGPATVFSPIILCSRLLVFQLLTFFKTSENNQKPLHYSGISVNLSYQGALSMDTQQIASGCNWIYGCHHQLQPSWLLMKNKLPFGATLNSHYVKPALYQINGYDGPNPSQLCWKCFRMGGGPGICQSK